jgi:hypothetical protein
MDNEKNQGNRPEQSRPGQDPSQRSHDQENEQRKQPHHEPGQQPHTGQEEKKAPGQGQSDMERERKRA